ncbi:putative 2-oxo-4-hydroxy-4-carboxy-5-ureidoimidazoline decarboxylase isoform X2 [Ovis aries]|uniref:Uncharacterized protein n=1 Tax=Ovis aries TaxID=9940 RepID=A0AC11DZ28_SHEEP|nr:putative 2-oxo-4-hydroxy-4-carboxy-5-ureidoimidazoline decarboxylase isoform X2 [Ovis aries]
MRAATHRTGVLLGATPPGDRPNPWPGPPSNNLVPCAGARPLQSQEGVLRCHPELAGRQPQCGRLSAESQREQSAAGLQNLGAAERLRFTELTAQYRTRFGFPFVLAVRLSDPAAAPRELARRLRCPPAQELRTALGEVKKICHLRLADLLGEQP